MCKLDLKDGFDGQETYTSSYTCSYFLLRAFLKNY